MAEVVLNCARAIVCELLTAAMAQHVRVDREREASSLAGPRHHALITGHAQRCQKCNSLSKARATKP